MKQKFYYIDDSGKKKKYVGAIHKNEDGTFTGYLTQNYKTISENVELTRVPAVAHVQGNSEFFTYINKDGVETRFTGWPKINGDKYEFTYNEYIIKELTYVPAIESHTEYFTYIDKNGEEQLWIGKAEYDNLTGKYYGKIKK